MKSTTDTKMKEWEEKIREICTYYSELGEGTAGYSLSEEQFEELFKLISTAQEEARLAERKRIYETLHKEVNKYFIDPLFPNLKVAITEILFKVMPETKRVATPPTKDEFDDLKPFTHGEEGTHYACAEIANSPKETVCCGCTGHKCKEEGK